MTSVIVLACAMFATSAERAPLLIHVMPWFSANEEGLGWHWTMNRSSEDVRASGQVASHFRPLIDAYDSLDPDVIELHVAWMKLSGFDGVLADWYGTQPHFDYPMIHERTKALFEVAGRAGLSIGVVYEDQTVGNAIREKLIDPGQAESIARETGEFLARQWFPKGNWLRFKGLPVVMVFGPQHFKKAEWRAFRAGAGEHILLTLHRVHRFSQGGYDWPIPSLGLEYTRQFGTRSRAWRIRVAVAFPRFKDYYEAGGQEGYPEMPDRDGQTYRDTLDWAVSLRCDAIQVATWNDWQEGTQIEPSVELGMRDLIVTQEARRRLDPEFRFVAADLEMPLMLFRLRKQGVDRARLGPIGEALLAGDVDTARRELAGVVDAADRAGAK